MKDRLVCGYRGYQDLVGVVYSADMGDYRKAIKHNGGGGETSTEVNTIEIPSVEITLRDSTQFYK